MFREMMVVGLKVLPLYAAYVIVTSHQIRWQSV